MSKKDTKKDKTNNKLDKSNSFDCNCQEHDCDDSCNCDCHKDNKTSCKKQDDTKDML